MLAVEGVSVTILLPVVSGLLILVFVEAVVKLFVVEAEVAVEVGESPLQCLFIMVATVAAAIERFILSLFGVAAVPVTVAALLLEPDLLRTAVAVGTALLMLLFL